MERKIFLMICIAVFAWVGSGFAVYEDVLLLPARPGEVSEVVPLSRAHKLPSLPSIQSLPQVDQVLMYDSDTYTNYLGGLLAGDTLVNWFKSPAACTLLEIRFSTYPAYQLGGISFDALAADAQSVTMNDYEEYHGAGSSPGPSPLDSIFETGTSFSDTLTDPHWDTLVVASLPDVGTNAFVGGWISPDSTPNPIIDPTIPLPYYSIIWRPDPASGIPGWYSSWHLFYTRALVRMYENPPPVLVSWDRLGDTYDTGARTATANFTDMGIPLNLGGVETAGISYTVNGGAPTVAPMTLISGDSSDGVWSAAIPGQAAGDTVDYTVSGTDYQGATTSGPNQTYIIRAGTLGECVLFVNEGEYYPGSGGFDVISTVLASYDYWEDTYGPPDASVLNFGYDVIIWFTWTGSDFVSDTLLIANYLDNGGNLWMSSVDLIGGGFGYGFGGYTTNPGEFVQDYLHITAGTDDFTPPDTGIDITGLPGDTISDPLSTFFIWPYAWAPGNNWSGEFTSDGMVDEIFFYPLGEICGYKFEGTVGGSIHKLAFLYWPMTYIEVPGFPDSADVASQVALASRTIEWLGCPVVGVEEAKPPATPNVFLLGQNRPNPAGLKAEIYFSLPRTSEVSLKIYDITGRLVKDLLGGEMKAGEYTIPWNLSDHQRSAVSSGIYFYRLTAGDFSATRKMVVLR